MAENEEPVTIDAERARAGATPRMTRYILAISLALVVVVYAILLWT